MGDYGIRHARDSFAGPTMRQKQKSATAAVQVTKLNLVARGWDSVSRNTDKWWDDLVGQRSALRSGTSTVLVLVPAS